MKTKALIRILASPLMICALASASAAEGNWVSLFNGKDLTGWQQKNGLSKYPLSDGGFWDGAQEESNNSL